MSTNEEDVDMDYLITLVQEREILWDKSNVDFKNKTLKAKACKQIAKISFPDYDNFACDKKNQIGNDIVKKWTRVKDNFYKYLKKIKDASKSGSGAKNLKKYHFYQQLLFLIKMTQNETDSSLDVTGEANIDSTSDIAPESSRYISKTRKRTMQADDFENEALKAFKVLQIITEMSSISQPSSSSRGFQQTSHQPLTHGYHTNNYRSTYTSTSLNSDYNSLTSPG